MTGEFSSSLLKGLKHVTCKLHVLIPPQGITGKGTSPSFTLNLVKGGLQVQLPGPES